MKFLLPIKQNETFVTRSTDILCTQMNVEKKETFIIFILSVSIQTKWTHRWPFENYRRNNNKKRAEVDFHKIDE